MAEIIEGRNPVIEALKAGRSLNKILLARNIGRHGSIASILQLARSAKVPVEYVPRQLIEEESATSSHQGILAYAAAKDYHSLDELLVISREKRQPPLYCILDGIEDPHNLGAIIRTAEASGVHGIIIRSRRAVGLTAAVTRASAGAVEYMPVARVNNISQAIATLKRSNIWIYGIDATASTNYTQLDFKLPAAFVIGNEGSGISELVKKNCDLLASIPMKGRVSSLNASVAAALVMYEALKQRD
jgi:23S rRNA (guanosine2251-2'-O)-methyltransferase